MTLWKRHSLRFTGNLTQDARIRYASDTIEDILGYPPHEVKNKSCWEYFHPDEIPFARTIHGRGVKLDKAAVLNYCQIKHKDGLWVGCECVFTVVYDVLVASTSIYRRDSRSQKRAADAPVVRSLFTSSPRDPRYHMLTYISSKFSQLPRRLSHEPRAALFLNRFTRTSTIMFATNGVTEILGVTPQQLLSKSFYFCIQERCLRDAVCCLESAKANDSIAYLRFWYRNPLQDDVLADDEDDMQMTDASDLYEDNDINLDIEGQQSTCTNALSHSANGSRSGDGNRTHTQPQIEVEAVVSCSSDGLVVVLRRARPPIPHNIHQTQGSPVYANGLFASPWATDPIFSHSNTLDTLNNNNNNNNRTPQLTNQSILPGNHPARVTSASSDTTALSTTTTSTSTASTTFAAGGGSHSQLLLDTIRDVAVFAWGVVGINGSLEQYKRGTPMGESQPPGGLRIWDPQSRASQRLPLANNRGSNGSSSSSSSNNTNNDTTTYRTLCREAGSCRSVPSGQPQEPGGGRECSQGSDDETKWRRIGNAAP